jgi:hypothetical protein
VIVVIWAAAMSIRNAGPLRGIDKYMVQMRNWLRIWRPLRWESESKIEVWSRPRKGLTG